MEELERQVQQAVSLQQRWASVPVLEQAAENADTSVESRAKWSKIYRLFGARTESQQDEVFAAVSVYFLRNGASPRGKYSKPIKTAGGSEVLSGEVVKVVGKLPGEIRQFLRGRLHDSYSLLKYNPAIAEDEQLATIAENAAVPRANSWLLADWLGRDCPYFVGQEAEIYSKLRSGRIQNAYDKRAVAQEEPNPVRDYAPEAKVAASRNGAVHGGHNDDLF